MMQNIKYLHYVEFGEIVFLAISAQEQVRGYGTRLMNHLKDYAKNHEKLTHFLTYADNNAIGYFQKQGFTREIFLEREKWGGLFEHCERLSRRAKLCIAIGKKSITMSAKNVAHPE